MYRQSLSKSFESKTFLTKLSAWGKKCHYILAWLDICSRSIYSLYTKTFSLWIKRFTILIECHDLPAIVYYAATPHLIKKKYSLQFEGFFLTKSHYRSGGGIQTSEDFIMKKIIEFHHRNSNHRIKCIQMNTNLPSIGSVICVIGFEIW